MRGWEAVHGACLDREFGDHVASCVGVVLDEMLTGRVPEMQSAVNGAVAEMGKYMELSEGNLMEEMAATTKASANLIQALDASELDEFVLPKEEPVWVSGTVASREEPWLESICGSVRLRFRCGADIHSCNGLCGYVATCSLCF